MRIYDRFSNKLQRFDKIHRIGKDGDYIIEDKILNILNLKSTKFLTYLLNNK